MELQTAVKKILELEPAAVIYKSDVNLYFSTADNKYKVHRTSIKKGEHFDTFESAYMHFTALSKFGEKKVTPQYIRQELNRCFASKDWEGVDSLCNELIAAIGNDRCSNPVICSKLIADYKQTGKVRP